MPKFVEVRKLIADKNPALLRWLPGFVIRWIEKIIHQKEVNEFFEEHEGADTFEFCKDVLEYLEFKVSIQGIENIPQAPERIIFASNHKATRGFPFNLYMINLDGTGLTRITEDETFDAFPVFSNDGKYLVFSSNRNNGGGRDTNLFVAEWIGD